MIDTGVKCWGNGSSGKLGNASETDSPLPVSVRAVDYHDDRIFASGFNS